MSAEEQIAQLLRERDKLTDLAADRWAEIARLKKEIERLKASAQEAPW